MAFHNIQDHKLTSVAARLGLPFLGLCRKSQPMLHSVCHMSPWLWWWCARHSQGFLRTNSFNPHNNCVRQELLLFLVLYEKTLDQNNWLTFLETHSTWCNQNLHPAGLAPEPRLPATRHYCLSNKGSMVKLKEIKFLWRCYRSLLTMLAGCISVSAQTVSQVMGS